MGVNIIRGKLFVTVIIVLAIAYALSSTIISSSNTVYPHLSDDLLVEIGNGSLRILFKNINGEVLLRKVSVGFGKHQCSINVNTIVRGQGDLLVSSINESGLSLSLINGSKIEYRSLNAMNFSNCLKELLKTYASGIRISLRDVKIYSPENTTSSKFVYYDNFSRLFSFLDRYPLYDFHDNALFVMFRINSLEGYLNGSYNLSLGLHDDSETRYSVVLHGLPSGFSMLLGPSFAWFNGIRRVRGFEVGLERIDNSLLDPTIIDIVIGFIKYDVPNVTLEFVDEKGNTILIKPWVDLEDPQSLLKPLVDYFVRAYMSLLFARIDPSRFSVDNPRLLLSNFIVDVGLTLSFNVRARGRIVGLNGFDESPYYLVFKTRNIVFNGKSYIVLRIDYATRSRIGMVVLPASLHLDTTPRPSIDRTLCMDFIDSVCLYIDNVSEIILDMYKYPVTMIYLEPTSIFHSQLSAYAIRYPGITPYIAITIGYTPHNVFTLYPLHPAVRVENISRINVVELENSTIWMGVSLTVKYPNNMSSAIIIEPYLMLPLYLRVHTNNTLLHGLTELNKTYTYRIEDYEYQLVLNASDYPYVYLSPMKIMFPENSSIDNALLVIACGNGLCDVKTSNNTITVDTPYKVRIMFFIKGERNSIIRLLDKYIRIIDYYGTHRLNYPGILSSYILPNNTSIVFGWTLLLPPRNNSVKIVFYSTNTIIEHASTEKILWNTLAKELDIYASEGIPEQLIIASIITITTVLTILYIVLKR